jgi:hypothetical protein
VSEGVKELQYMLICLFMPLLEFSAAYDLDNVNSTLNRYNFNAIVRERDILKTYLPAFKACVREGSFNSFLSVNLKLFQYHESQSQSCSFFY